jgi:hypothetical protein
MESEPTSKETEVEKKGETKWLSLDHQGLLRKK